MSALNSCSLPGPSWTLPFQARERLRLAILQGNRINQERVGSYPSKSPRRALLVAIQYLDDPEFGAIEATPYDVLHIYDMLLSQGYTPQDIRILSSGVGTNSENDDLQSMPTRENIMVSLRWLVEDAEAGDYRYFHFSGHGISYESTVAGGKVAQVVPAPASIPGDYPERQPRASTRIELQVIHASQLKYYNEAIVAHRTPGLDDFDDNLIYDKELNDEFARLPKHSFLTVSLDSCHSGRMINNNFKLAGAGLRGKLTHLAWQLGSPSYPNPVLPPAQLPAPASILSLSTLRHGSGKLFMTGLVTMLTCSLLIFCVIVGLVATICCFAWTIPSAYLLKGCVILTDKLPYGEQNMDKIKATIFHWSSSHQREKAADYSNHRGGFFTYAFCNAIRRIPSSGITVGKLYEDVQQELAVAIDELNRVHKSNHLQNCQLWTSLGDDNEIAAKQRLDLFFII